MSLESSEAPVYRLATQPQAASQFPRYAIDALPLLIPRRSEYRVASPDSDNVTSLEAPSKKRSRDQHDDSDRSDKDADLTGEDDDLAPPKKKVRTSNGPKPPTNKAATITLMDVVPYFAHPIREAAASLGLCTTLLKQLCRRLGVKRWPQRKLSAIDRRVGQLEAKLAKNNISEEDRRRYQREIATAQLESETVIANAASGGDIKDMSAVHAALALEEADHLGLEEDQRIGVAVSDAEFAQFVDTMDL